MKKKIYLSSPHMGGKEQDYIKSAFDTNWIAPLGPHVSAFEKELSKYTGAAHAAVLSSGTSAIHLALILLDVKPKDYVICQSFTFSATANPITYQGATPVFVDSEKETWNMCPKQLEKAIKHCLSDKKNPKKPKAIIPVHLYGMPAKIDKIMAIAEKYDIPVIEDAAESLGSSIDEKQTGSFGKFGILSFNGNKIITTSGGGALLSDDGEMIKKARFLATQARDEAPHYQHSQIGYNYRMSNVLAGIGLGQMKVLKKRIAERRKNFERYQDLFESKKALGYNVEMLEEPKGSFCNRWLTTVLINPKKNKGITRDTLRLAFESENIESRPLWKPMHMQPVFEKYPFFGDGTSEKLFEIGLCLPSGTNMTEKDWDRIEKVLNEVFI
ncbi:MAG: aminotransferase class I/II-fold pyridoxal phosphate-dependent enzyme [Bacteroidetes bacterium]|nr:aminotransferase class I/II-fold pyridoxal phosphate-dependent enzyme [Bacteroidota bacterium]